MRSRILALLLSAAACRSSGPPSTSGFLGDYSGFERSRVHPNTWVQFTEGVDLRDYDRLVIDPVVVLLAPGSTAEELGSRTLGRVASEYRRILLETIAPYYTVVEKPGPHTLRIRVAVTDVRPGTAASAGATDPDLGSAATEIEIVDSITKKRLAAAIDRSRGSAGSGSDVPERWRGVERIFRDWSKRLLDYLDREMK